MTLPQALTIPELLCLSWLQAKASQKYRHSYGIWQFLQSALNQEIPHVLPVFCFALFSQVFFFTALLLKIFESTPIGITLTLEEHSGNLPKSSFFVASVFTVIKSEFSAAYLCNLSKKSFFNGNRSLPWIVTSKGILYFLLRKAPIRTCGSIQCACSMLIFSFFIIFFEAKYSEITSNGICIFARMLFFIFGIM